MDALSSGPPAASSGISGSKGRPVLAHAAAGRADAAAGNHLVSSPPLARPLLALLVQRDYSPHPSSRPQSREEKRGSLRASAAEVLARKTGHDSSTPTRPVSS